MMERLRAGADSLVVKVILGLIILSFIFAGVGSYLIGGTEEPVAVVGKIEISRAQFEQNYQNERQRMQDQAGEIFTSLMADPSYSAQFRANVLERMINQSLLDQYAKNLGLRASDESVKEEIRAIPAFLNNGIFNNEQYLAALRRNGLVPDQFAELIRQDLVRQQLVDALQNSEFSLNKELETLYKLEEQSRTIRSLTLPLSEFANKVDITQEEKDTYYKNNSLQFMRPEQFKISYIELSGASLANSVEISDQDAKAFYDANLSRYGSSEQRKVSHIMIEGDSDEQKQEAQSILDQLNAGGDFAELAKTRSQDSFSAEQGGQLDWFDKGVMDPAFEDAAFALTEVGQLTEVVKSDFGFHIIKLDEVSPSDTKPFAEVQEEILTELKAQQASENFYSLSNTLAQNAFEMPDSLTEAANAVNLEVKTTDFVSLDALSGSLASPMVRQALLEEEVRDGLNSDLIELSSENAIVVRIDEIRPEIILPYAEVEQQVMQRLQNEKGEEAMRVLANTLVDELNAGKDEALKASSYQFSEAREIKRNGGENPDIAKLAFSMPVAKESAKYNYTRSSTGDLILIALDAVAEPTLENVDLRTLMATRVEQDLANTNLNALLEQLKQEIKIKNNLSSVSLEEF